MEKLENDYFEFTTRSNRKLEEEEQLVKALDDCNRRTMNQTAPEDIDQYADYTDNRCLKMISTLNKKLARFGSVNMKAATMYDGLIEQKNALEKRMKIYQKAQWAQIS